jgi:hypothetical protein
VRSFTNRAQRWKGQTTSVTVRLPDPVVKTMDDELDGITIRNRSEFLQHWVTVGTMVMANPELAEALDWALDQAEPPVPSILDEPMIDEVVVEYAEDPAQEYPAISEVDLSVAPAEARQVSPDPVQAVYDDILTRLRSKVR